MFIYRILNKRRNQVRNDSDRHDLHVLIFRTAHFNLKLVNFNLKLEHFSSKLEHFDSKLEFFNSKLEVLNSKLEFFNSKLKDFNSKFSTRNSKISTRNSKKKKKKKKKIPDVIWLKFMCDSVSASALLSRLEKEIPIKKKKKKKKKRTPQLTNGRQVNVIRTSPTSNQS